MNSSIFIRDVVLHLRPRGVEFRKAVKESRAHIAALDRHLKFFFACAFVALWVFPSIVIEQRIWSNREQQWVTFQEDYRYRFVTMVDYGEVPVGFSRRSSLGETVQTWIAQEPQRGFVPRVQRRVSVNWITQGAETALFLLIGTATVANAKRQHGKAL